MELKNKVVVLTGGSSGIGYALAKKLSSLGSKVHSLDIQAPAEPLPNVKHHDANITREADVEKAVGEVVLEEKEVHILINNAGVVRRGTLWDLSDADWDLVMGVNLKGSWLMMKHCGRHFTKDAVILQVSSRRALYLPADPGIYALAKASSALLTQIMAKSTSATVKIAYPGPVDTPLSHYGRTPEQEKEVANVRMSPEEMADKLITFIASEYKELSYDQDKNTYTMR